MEFNVATGIFHPFATIAVIEVVVTVMVISGTNSTSSSSNGSNKGLSYAPLHQLWSTGWNEKSLNVSNMRDRSDDPLHSEGTL